MNFTVDNFCFSQINSQVIISFLVLADVSQESLLDVFLPKKFDQCLLVTNYTSFAGKVLEVMK